MNAFAVCASIWILTMLSSAEESGGNTENEHSSGMHGKMAAMGLPEYDSSSFVSFIILVPSGRFQCYYYKARSDFSMEYQVLAGGYRDIAIFVEDPFRNMIYRFAPSINNYFRIHILREFVGKYYRVCLDNEPASRHLKKIYFKIDGDLVYSDDMLQAFGKFDVALYRTYQTIKTIRDIYHRKRTFEFGDRHQMDENLKAVTLWPLIQILVMFCASIYQVVMIKRMLSVN